MTAKSGKEVQNDSTKPYREALEKLYGSPDSPHVPFLKAIAKLPKKEFKK